MTLVSIIRNNQTSPFSILLLCLSLLSCNGNDEQDKNRNGGFFNNLFSSESLPVLEAEEISVALDESSNMDVLVYPEEVNSFYNSRANKPVWNSDELRENFFEQITKTENDGLIPADYHQKRLQELQETAAKSREQQAKYEILLSDAFFILAHDLYYGKLDPQQLHWIWDVNREPFDFSSLLGKIEDSGTLENAFKELRPQHEVYSGLMRSLADYRKALETGEEDFNQIPSGEAIEPGDKDQRIPGIATRLQELGFLDNDFEGEGTTYIPKLAKAVEQYQENQHMAADGIIGNTTLKEMNMSKEDRYNQILVNLERWRWYPRDLGAHYILINIPQYKLAVVKDGDTIRNHDVIAGTRERQTPIFSDQLDHIVLNPTWTLPPTIKAEDVIPKAISDASYFSKNNMHVSSPEGEAVDPSSVDWSSSDALNYTVTQRAGPTNPLGRVKIMYPNQYSIYLHDTPGQSLFDRSQRAASSGCVRVQGAMDLANYVTSDQTAINEGDFDEILASGETTSVKIEQPIQVYHFYWTAWREDGKTVFSEDVYDMDQKIADALNQ